MKTFISKKWRDSKFFLFQKKVILAILYTPFILSFGLLLVLPFIIFLFWISSDIYVFGCLLILPLIAISVFNFLVLQKIIGKKKDSPTGKIVYKYSLVMLLISWGFFAIADIMATIKLNRTIAQATSHGIRMNFKQLIPPPVPDKLNAAPFYEEAYKIVERLEDRYKKEWDYMPYDGMIRLEEMTTQHKKTISKVMKDPEFVKTYTLIEKAVNMSYCRFDINYDEGFEMDMPHFSKLRRLARVIADHTYILGWEGKYEQAWKSAIAGFCLSDSLKDEPFVISKLVYIAIDLIAVRSFKHLINNYGDKFSVSNYHTLIKIIDQKNRYLMKHGLEGDLALSVRESKKFKSPIKRGLPFLIIDPILKEDLAFYILATTDLIQMTDKPFYLIKEKLYDWKKLYTCDFEIKHSLKDRFILFKHLLSSLLFNDERILEIQARYNARLDTFKLAIALQIYRKKWGNYPDNLSSLCPEIISELPLDPFTGKDYIYCKKGNGFIVYSVGFNQKDDGGIENCKQGKDDINFSLKSGLQ